MESAVAKINCNALRENLLRVRELAPQSRVLAVVKSNAYGHGLAAVSETLSDNVDGLAVASVDEGLRCRAVNSNADSQTPIVILSDLQHPSMLQVCAENNLELVLFDDEHLHWLNNYRGKALNVWLKVDTGMTRLGIAPQEVTNAVAQLKNNAHINTIRLMSHLANAEDIQDDATPRQLKRFQQCTAAHNLECSLANSAGVINWQQTHYEWVRPGIMLYGVSPVTNSAAHLKLKPVMQLEARLLSIKTAAVGEAVGYGGEFITPTQMKIGVVNFGYGDGYPRVFHSQSPPQVLINDTRANIIGRVAMNLITIDLSDCPQAKIGDTVILWGDKLDVNEIAERAGTIGYELLCKVSERIPRIVQN